MISFRLVSLVSFVLFVASSEAFSVLPSNQASRASTSLNIFGDALKNAFGNDDSLGKVQNAGLSGVCLFLTNQSYLS